ncbi:hypothetical protein [Streptomyces sp. JJ38]|uniref:hypothetical protein n=1 Tax=Streptomyces sp. JJ38 TaxID=2738128 RepID=UPI00214CC050|nr:hypothetical protein [Streptomyces sp. JJ38]MBW1597743.1 hypothetical protein [Streptomyces sp. JJ38]
MVDLHSKSLTLAQHREVLALSDWLALLVGCVEYDMGNRHGAESTRRAALSLATETGHGDRGIVAAAQAGAKRAANHGVAV